MASSALSAHDVRTGASHAHGGETRDTSTAFDLFCGAGRSIPGLRAASSKVLVGVDLDPDAAATYRANHPGTMLLEKAIGVGIDAGLNQSGRGAGKFDPMQDRSAIARCAFHPVSWIVRASVAETGAK